jgi:hypothetical protein
MSSLKPEAHALKRLSRHLDECASGPQLRIREFWIPQTHGRADLAVIDDRMCGFEIKTAQDSLKRLSGQVGAYNLVFDRCTLVVAEKHFQSALEMLPAFWGVLVLPDVEEQEITEVRAATDNPLVDPQTLIRLMWKQEAEAALDQLRVSYDEKASRYRLWQAVLDAAAPGSISDHVRNAILTRDISKARIPTRRFRPLPAALA